MVKIIDFKPGKENDASVRVRKARSKLFQVGRGERVKMSLKMWNWG